MRLLDKLFTANYDKCGDHRFTQIKRVETPSLACYIYRRDKMDGTLFCYEVFAAKQRKKGDKLPGGVVEAEDRERFPTKNDFGFTAKDAGKSLENAEELLEEFVTKMKDKEDKKNGVKASDDSEATDGDGFMEALTQKMNIVPKIRGRKRKERANIAYPTVEQWTMKDLLNQNPEWTQPLAYIQLAKDRTAGIVVEVARIKNSSGRGRAMVVYSTSPTAGNGQGSLK